MSKKLYEENNIAFIADAIRNKGISGTFKTSDMDDAINNIKTFNNECVNVEKITDYLYDIYYNFLDYEYAYDYFTDENLDIFGCSTFAKNNFLCRNFDWYYNNYSEFIVHTPNKYNKNATLGVAGMFNIVNKEDILSFYKIIPFILLDGINEHGLAMSTNIIYTDAEPMVATIPEIEVYEEINSLMLVRFCLDKFTSADECIDYLKKYVSIYPSSQIQQHQYEQSYLLKDKNKCYIIEIINNELIYYEHNIMTNFNQNEINYNDDGSIYTPETQTAEANAYLTNHVNNNGHGLERYNLINSSFDSLNDENDYIDLLKKLRYTNNYNLERENFWYTDFINQDNNLNITSSPDDFMIDIISNITLFNNRSRSINSEYYGTWQTVHSCIYNIDDLTLKIMVQENDDIYQFDLLSDIIKKIFSKLNIKYDNVVLNNGDLTFYSNNNIIKTINIASIINEVDPYFNKSPAQQISYNDMESWNNKKDKSEIEDEYLRLENYMTS